MRSPGLVVGVIGATLVVGYAFYMLTQSSSSPRPERVGTERSEAKARPKPRRPGARPATRPGRRPVPEPGLRSDEPRRAPAAPARGVADGEAPTPAPAAGLPPRPEPKISLEEAREKFSEYMAVLQRLDDEGVTLESPQWVEYYKTGHDALLPLQQHLDWQVPDEAAELRKANEDMRTMLQKLEPRAAPP